MLLVFLPTGHFYLKETVSLQNGTATRQDREGTHHGCRVGVHLQHTGMGRNRPSGAQFAGYCETECVQRIRDGYRPEHTAGAKRAGALHSCSVLWLWHPASDATGKKTSVCHTRQLY